MMTVILTATLMFACKDEEESSSSGGSATLEISASDASHSFDLNGGSKTVTVTASTMFTVEMAATDWLTISEISITGFKINVAENANIESRNAKLLLSLKGAENIEIDVSQSGSPTLTVDRPAVEFNSGGGETVVFVNSTSYTATVSGGANWMTATASGTKLRIWAELNTAMEERNASVTIHVDGFQDVTLAVKQESYVPSTLSIDPASLEFTSFESEKTVEVTTNRATFTATVEEGSDWISAEISGSNLIVKVKRNNSINVREASVTVHVEGANDVTLTVTQQASSLTGVWSFDDPGNLVKATVGQDLIPHGSGFTPVEGPSASNRAVRVDKGSYGEALHGIKANGGGEKVNRFTVMFDFKVSELGRYYCFIQTTLANNDDGEFFLRPAGNLGIGGTGYSEYVATVNEWHRLVISADMGSFYKYYVDGVLIHEGNSNASIDSRYAWDPEGVLFFADEDGEDADIDIAEIAVWSEPLTDEEIAKLGSPQ